MDLTFSHVAADARVTIERVDDDHGNVLKEFAAMGAPLDPSPAQVDELNRKTALPVPEQTKLHEGRLRLTLIPNALALIKVQP
jgi:xylan 1,4-beta-xylosidase